MQSASDATETLLSPNEIRGRLTQFVDRHREDRSEMAEYATFWDDLFYCYGALRPQLARLQYPVPKIKGTTGAIDLLWKTVMLVEHKSRGEDLDKAYGQAHDYVAMLQPYERPRHVVLCDFARFRVYDLTADTLAEFLLEELPERWSVLGFMGGHGPKQPANEVPVDFAAVALLGDFYDRLKDAGYPDHHLQRLLVRVLFCLFAEDTGVFEPDVFTDFLKKRTLADGSDLGLRLEQFFRVLDLKDDAPQRKSLEDAVAGLPYVNGALFADRLEMAFTNSKMRDALMHCTEFDWSRISPAVFGSLFQGVMDSRERRAAGAHYTSEANILKVIQPLFLDELRAEYEAALTDKSTRQTARLSEFHKKLGVLKFLDPACGCGNFLVIAYRELRRLETDVMRALYGKALAIDVRYLSRLRVSQFYGIEIAEFPAEIARVAMWLMDHVMNVELSAAFGQYFVRLPLTEAANILHANALQADWRGLLPASECSYVMGNPPFVGKKEQSAAQKADQAAIWQGVKGAGVLDYVTCWFRKAAEYVDGQNCPVAFVSTNSVSQGEQVGILWDHLFTRWRMSILFAHRAFPWTSEARGKAHVHVVIIGFGQARRGRPRLYQFDLQSRESAVSTVANINPYLVEGADVVVLKRYHALNATRPAVYGSMMIDKDREAGDEAGLVFGDLERAELLAENPELEPYIKRIYGGEELLNATSRWCLWLVGAPPSIIAGSPKLRARIDGVRKFRLRSRRRQTQRLAATPGLFGEIRQPSGSYLLIPKVSSESRLYIPVGFLGPEDIASGSALIVPDATPFEFGVLSSAMHNSWMRAVAGRLESRYQYSNQIVYNNFPWPAEVTEGKRSAIEAATGEVLDARAKHLAVGVTLATLYDPLATPPDLAKAHAKLDRTVERAYRSEPFRTERERVEFLFDLFVKATALGAPMSGAPNTNVIRSKKVAVN